MACFGGRMRDRHAVRLHIGSARAKFGYSEVKIGFLPAIVSVFLTRQVGEKRARDLLLTGRLVEAPEAKELGLVNDTQTCGEPDEEGACVAETILSASPSTSRAPSICSFPRPPPAWIMISNGRCSRAREARCTPDFKEGLAAFLEKRNRCGRGRPRNGREQVEANQALSLKLASPGGKQAEPGEDLFSVSSTAKHPRRSTAANDG